MWGVRVYDATLWIVGPQYSAASPHALDIEPGRAVPSDTLVKNAIAEMRDLKVGDERQLAIWQAEMRKLLPNLKQGDQVVIFCPDTQADARLREQFEHRRDRRSIILPGDHERMASSANQTSGDAEVAAQTVTHESSP